MQNTSYEKEMEAASVHSAGSAAPGNLAAGSYPQAAPGMGQVNPSSANTTASAPIFPPPGPSAPGVLPYPTTTAGTQSIEMRMPQEPPPSYFPPDSKYSTPIQSQPYTVTQIITTPTMVPLGSNPCTIICPHCRANITTKVDYEAGSCTHLWACILCCFVCWPLAWVPYVVDECKDASHECPNCGENLGVYKR